MIQSEFESQAVELKDDLKFLSLEDNDMDNLKILLSYEMWIDGMDFEDMVKFYEELDWSKDAIINYLEEVFEY